VVGEELLRERLVAGQDQSARIAACIRHPEQLQIAHHVLVEAGHAREGFQEIEDDLRFEAADAVADGREVVMDPEHGHVVTALAERLDHVVLHLPFGLAHVESGRVLGRHEMVVHEREDARLLHRKTRCPPLCR
jgi:hypothetical protein